MSLFYAWRSVASSVVVFVRDARLHRCGCTSGWHCTRLAHLRILVARVIGRFRVALLAAQFCALQCGRGRQCALWHAPVALVFVKRTADYAALVRAVFANRHRCAQRCAARRRRNTTRRSGLVAASSIAMHSLLGHKEFRFICLRRCACCRTVPSVSFTSSIDLHAPTRRASGSPCCYRSCQWLFILAQCISARHSR
jgi:hypothetical protein